MEGERMKGRVLIVVVVAGVLWGVPSSNGQPSDEERIRRARDASNEAIRNHDSEKVASFWAEDYILVSSNNSHVTGKAANRKNFADHFEERKDVLYVRTPQELGFYHPWGMAYEIGTWEGGWSEGEGRVELGGTYLAKWQKVSDRWLIHAEIFVPTECKGSDYCDAKP